MEDKIKISIVICAYNAEAYISEALDSVFAQELARDNFEIIVVDDGSTDATAAIVKTKYQSNVRYFYRKNGGHTAAVNTALQFVRGEYICFLDADDYWDKEKLNAVLVLFEGDKEVDLVYNYYRMVDVAGNIMGYRPDLNNTNPDFLSEEHLREHLAGRVPFKTPTSGISVRRACLEKMGSLAEENIFPDLLVQNILPFYARKIRYIRKCLHSYRLHENNTWENKKFSPARVDAGIKIRQNIRKQVVIHAQISGYDATKFLSRIDLDINKENILLLRAKGKIITAFWLALTVANPIYDRHSNLIFYYFYSRFDLICQSLLSRSLYEKIYTSYVHTDIYKKMHQFWHINKKTR